MNQTRPVTGAHVGRVNVSDAAVTPTPAHVSASASYLGASAKALQHHYDVSNEFFALWLDKELLYTCALWEDGDTLESAQIRKLDYYIEQAKAKGVGRILDVGCGWGALSKRLVDVYGVGHAVCLNLSAAQIAHIRAWNHPRIEARLENWHDHAPSESYDAILAIGVLEHCARWTLSVKSKIRAYRALFSRCHQMLTPGGYLVLQTIAFGKAGPVGQRYFPLLGRLGPSGTRALLNLARRFRPLGALISSSVRSLADLPDDIDPLSLFEFTLTFEESNLPRLAEIAEASEQLFEMTVVRNDREHYARTTREWSARLRAKRAEATRLVGEEVVAKYLRYLQLAAQMFDSKSCELLRLTYRRID